MFAALFIVVLALYGAQARPQLPKGVTTPPAGATAPVAFEDPNGLSALLSDVLSGSGGRIPNGPAPKGCAKHEIIVARGTGEPGPFGVVVGDPLVAAVVGAIPGTRGYAVQYPANFDLAVSPNRGADDIIHRLNQQNEACPEETFALVGYSQGAGAIHAAFATILFPYPGVESRPTLNKAALQKIKAVVLFGDPGNKGTEGPAGTYVPRLPEVLEARLKEVCAPGDPVCDPKGTDSKQHLNYIQESYQKPAADYIEKAFTSPS